MKVTFTPPGGPTSPAVEEKDGDAYAWRPNGNAVAWLLYNVMPFPTERGRFLLALLPTYLPDPTTDLPPAGAALFEKPDHEIRRFRCRQTVERSRSHGGSVSREADAVVQPGRSLGRPDHFPYLDRTCRRTRSRARRVRERP